MTTRAAKTKTKSRPESSPVRRQAGLSEGALTARTPVQSPNQQLSAFYSGGPAVGLASAVQAKVTIGQSNDPYEREADGVAARVVAGQPVTAISTLPPGGLSASVQRQEEEEKEEEPVQELTLQRQEEEEEEEEPVQELAVQRQEESEEREEPVQELAIQRQEEEEKEEEPVQELAVQRQEEEAEEEEEPVQEIAIQRQEEEEEEEEPEPVQELTIQRQEEEEEEEEPEPVQELTLQRQEEEEEEKTVQSREMAVGGGPSSQPSMSAIASHAIHGKDPGEPINPGTRSTLEAGMGTDLRDVRVHSDEVSHEAAGGLKAKAFTHKSHIWLGRGQSQDDLRLMAHETTHVLQQDGVVRRAPQEPEEEEEVPKKETARGEGGRPEPAVPKEEISAPVTEALEKRTPEPPAEIEHAPSAEARFPAERESTPLLTGAPPVTPELEERTKEEEKKGAGLEEEEEEAGATPAKEETAEEKTAGEEPPVEITPPEKKEAVTETEKSPGAAGAAPPKEAAKPEIAVGAEPKAVAPPEGEACVEGLAEETPAAAAPVPEAAAVTPAPETDLRFQEAQTRLDKLARKERGHAPVGRKVTSAERATEQPKNEPIAKGMIVRVDDMSQQSEQTEKQDKAPEESFIRLLEAALDRITPKTPEDVENLGEKGVGGDKLRAEVKSGVSQQAAQSTQAVGLSAKQDPQETGIETPESLPEDKKDASPARVGAEDVLPEPKPDAEISMEGDKRQADAELAKTGLTEEQLTKANEPSFDDAVNAKKDVHKNSDEAPQRYRQNETEYLKASAEDTKKEENKTRLLMRFVRNKTKQGTTVQQHDLMGSRTSERARIAGEIGKIYLKTKDNVLSKLKSLDSQVDTIFDDGHKAAFDTMKKNVARRLRYWKLQRYGKRALIPLVGGLIAAGTWLYDKIRGIDRLKDVQEIYFSERAEYIKNMKAVFRRIADKVETTLKDCKDEIKRGKDEVKEFVSKLDKGLRHFGRKAAKDISGKFDSLEQEVNDKKRELADRMANRYNESRKKVDKWIEEERAKNRGLIDKLIGFVRKIIETIKKLKALLDSALRKAKAAIKIIIADPIQFLKNVLAAVNKGFSQFVDNILTHLKAGLISWLFGTLGGAGITIPKDFSLKSIFGLVLQILGITKENIRAKLVKLIGPRAVAIIEKAWEFVSVLIKEGPAGLWAKIKESIGNLKEMVIEKIKAFVLAEIIKAAVKKLAMMFNPIGAFIQAAITIYNVVMFFVEQIERILRLVNTILDSILSIAKGKIDAAANWIEKTLAQTIPIIISFLARLLGLGGISKKVTDIINKVRRPIDKAIDKFLAKVVGKLKGLFGKGKMIVKKGGEKIFAWWKARKRFKVGGEEHVISFKGVGKNAKIMVATTPKTLDDYMNELRSKGVPAAKLAGVRKKRNEVDKLKSMKMTKSRGELIAKKLGQLASLLAKLLPKSKLPPSKVKFAPVNRGGGTVGKLMIAKPLSIKPGNTTGSVPRQSTPLWEDVKSRDIYIRGHLLNHLVYGPGENKNLTPITNSLNQTMEAQVESDVKNRVLSKNEVIMYKVDVKYGRRNRKPSWTPKEHLLATSIKFTLKSMTLKTGPARTGEKEEDWRVGKKIKEKDLRHDIP